MNKMRGMERCVFPPFCSLVTDCKRVSVVDVFEQVLCLTCIT